MKTKRRDRRRNNRNKTRACYRNKRRENRINRSTKRRKFKTKYRICKIKWTNEKNIYE